jgi:hypothetical protein
MASPHFNPFGLRSSVTEKYTVAGIFLDTLTFDNKIFQCHKDPVQMLITWGYVNEAF